MIAVVLVIHLILAVSIIGLVLLQRSEGGGIGLGTSGGLGSFATPQATASVMNRVTWGCAAGFFATSLILGILYNHASSRQSILDQLDQPVAAITEPAKDSTAKADDTPVVPDTAPPATPKVKKEAAEAKGKTQSKKPVKSEPSVPVTP